MKNFLFLFFFIQNFYNFALAAEKIDMQKDAAKRSEEKFEKKSEGKTAATNTEKNFVQKDAAKRSEEKFEKKNEGKTAVAEHAEETFAEKLGKMQIPDYYELPEITIGADDAPVNLIVYSSFTCFHCQKFHQEEFQKLKRKYIDTKKIKVIFRNYVDDLASFEAAVIVRYLGKNNFANIRYLTEKIYKNLDAWTHSPNPRDFLKKLFLNDVISNKKVTPEIIESALNDKKIPAGLMKEQQRAMHKYQIYSMPAFIITKLTPKQFDALPIENKKKCIHTGTLSIEKLSALIEIP